MKDQNGPLHTAEAMPHSLFNRLFALIYASAILALLYHHTTTLFFSTNLASFYITFSLLISDLVLAFMWLNTEAFRMYPIRRKEYPENLNKIKNRSEYPGLDVFICTADPYKEPPITVINTALSVMSYDYPSDRVSVYVSDDGGSALTLFALMEAAKFATHWLPFCKDNTVVERSPEAYFGSGHPSSLEIEKIKMMYESMKMKIEHVLDRGKVEDDFINGEEEQAAFNKWTDDFTRQNHPAVIQVLLDSSTDTDITGGQMPNLIYVSREKCKSSPHHFKAGALNVLLRVSAVMTNSPVILTIDCDMYSNDPNTPERVLCYLCDPDPTFASSLGYIQFPQRFHSINKHDIYAGQYKRLFEIQPMGLDGLQGPNDVGTGLFYSRRALFGSPSTLVPPEMPELSPDHAVDRPLQSRSLLALAHQVASSDFENPILWGSRIGFRYGTLVEDYFTGYRLQCEGWRAIFCNPKRAAFFGDAPVTLVDLLNQQKRWAIGLLEVAFSKYSPLTYGTKFMRLLMVLGYAQYAFWPIWSIPITAYAFLPQLALINKVYIFPKVSDRPWFILYVFLFLGANGQDFIDFVSVGGSIKSWWNDQRIWYIRGLTCYLFGSIEFLLHAFGFSRFGFNVTSKVVDDELSKRYDQGLFEFGVHSSMFVTLTMAALVNIVAFVKGLVDVLREGDFDGPFLQMLIAGFVVLNCWPLYEAVLLRSDGGKMPTKTTILATFYVSCLCLLASFVL